MRFIHTADLHLDSPMTAHLPGDKVSVRRREVNDSLRRVVEDGVSRGGEGVLIVGDLFDSEHVMPYTVDAVLSLMRDYPSLPFFYVAGNHEGSVLTGRDDRPSNLYILDGARPSVTLSGGIAIHAAASPRALTQMSLDPAAYNIVLLHAGVGERTDEDTVRLAELADRPIDYLALGHYHTYTEYRVSDRLLAVYSGASEGRGYDECGDKGYALLDTERREVRFIRTAKRRVEDLRVDISEARSTSDILRYINEQIGQAGVGPSDMLRVTLTGYTPPGLCRDTAVIGARFENAYFSFSLRDESHLRLDRASVSCDPTLKGEFVRTVLSDTTLSDEEKEDIIDCGLRYLQESVG